MGPSVLAAGPTYAGAKIINETVFKDQPDLSSVERNARAAGRIATEIGAVVGVAGTGFVRLILGFHSVVQ